MHPSSPVNYIGNPQGFLCATHPTVGHLHYGILTRTTHNKIDTKRKPFMVIGHLANIC